MLRLIEESKIEERRAEIERRESSTEKQGLRLLVQSARAKRANVTESSHVCPAHPEASEIVRVVNTK